MQNKNPPYGGFLFGGRGGNRTLMTLRSRDFESRASTNSATRPNGVHSYLVIYLRFAGKNLLCMFSYSCGFFRLKPGVFYPICMASELTRTFWTKRPDLPICSSFSLENPPPYVLIRLRFFCLKPSTIHSNLDV